MGVRARSGRCTRRVGWGPVLRRRPRVWTWRGCGRGSWRWIRRGCTGGWRRRGLRSVRRSVAFRVCGRVRGRRWGRLRCRRSCRVGVCWRIRCCWTGVSRRCRVCRVCRGGGGAPSGGLGAAVAGGSAAGAGDLPARLREGAGSATGEDRKVDLGIYGPAGEALGGVEGLRLRRASRASLLGVGVDELLYEVAWRSGAPWVAFGGVPRGTVPGGVVGGFGGWVLVGGGVGGGGAGFGGGGAGASVAGVCAPGAGGAGLGACWWGSVRRGGVAPWVEGDGGARASVRPVAGAFGGGGRAGAGRCGGMAGDGGLGGAAAGVVRGFGGGGRVGGGGFAAALRRVVVGGVAWPSGSARVDVRRGAGRGGAVLAFAGGAGAEPPGGAAAGAAVAGLPEGRRLRVLEVGAGTGATTGAVLAALPSGRTGVRVHGRVGGVSCRRRSGVSGMRARRCGIGVWTSSGTRWRRGSGSTVSTCWWRRTCCTRRGTWRSRWRTAVGCWRRRGCCCCWRGRSGGVGWT